MLHHDQKSYCDTTLVQLCIIYYQFAGQLKYGNSKAMGAVDKRPRMMTSPQRSSISSPPALKSGRRLNWWL